MTMKYLGTIPGSELNSILGMTLVLTDDLPLNEMTVLDPDHVAEIQFCKHGKVVSPGIDRYVEIDGLDGVFDGKEEYSVYFDTDSNYLVLKTGKDEYRARTYELDKDDPLPKWPDKYYEKAETHFDLDTKQLGRIGKKHDTYRFRTAVRPDGRKSVYMFADEPDEGYSEDNAVNLGTTWEGSEAAASYAVSYVSKWPRFGKVKVAMNNNYPAALRGSQGDLEYTYLIAPRVFDDNAAYYRWENKNCTDNGLKPKYSEKEITAAEEEYNTRMMKKRSMEDTFIASHNRKQKRSGRGLLDRFRRH